MSEEASLDHDLGPEDEVGTGHEVVNELDELMFLDPTFPTPVVYVHTPIAGARQRLELAVRALERRATRGWSQITTELRARRFDTRSWNGHAPDNPSSTGVGRAGEREEA